MSVSAVSASQVSAATLQKAEPVQKAQSGPVDADGDHDGDVSDASSGGSATESGVGQLLDLTV